MINMSAIWFERGKNTKVQNRFSRRMKVEQIFAFLENAVLKCDANTFVMLLPKLKLALSLMQKTCQKNGKNVPFQDSSASWHLEKIFTN